MYMHARGSEVLPLCSIAVILDAFYQSSLRIAVLFVHASWGQSRDGNARRDSQVARSWARALFNPDERKLCFLR
jgi:hypothetical protein